MRLKLLFFLFITSQAYGQSKTRFPIGTFNTQNTKIVGFSVGYTPAKKNKNVTSHGIRLDVGLLGLLLPLLPDMPIATSDTSHYKRMQEPLAEKINGINISALGVGCKCKVNGVNIYGVGSVVRQTNGVSLGTYANFAEVQNGMQGSIIWNVAYHSNGAQFAFVSNTTKGVVRGVQIAAANEASSLKGVQIGLYNKTGEIKGVQIGLWNVNEKRKFPILNF